MFIPELRQKERGHQMQSFNPARIIQKRKSLNKTQQDLARETGLSSTAIYYIEKGRRAPTAGTLGRIASALECNVDYFYEEKPDNSANNGQLV